jgi:mRNA interferase MazF
VTSNVRLAAAPGNVLLEQGTAGLDRDSVANVTQVLTLDRSTLDTRLGVLGGTLMSRVEAGLRLALGL